MLFVIAFWVQFLLYPSFDIIQQTPKIFWYLRYVIYRWYHFTYLNVFAFARFVIFKLNKFISYAESITKIYMLSMNIKYFLRKRLNFFLNQNIFWTYRKVTLVPVQSLFLIASVFGILEVWVTQNRDTRY